MRKIGYLREVQGLRIYAALLVAVYHIWFQRVSGGVDAFFVIAGFFIYSSLFKNGAPDWPNLLAYYKKTLARVVPSTSIVILCTCASFFLIGMESKWNSQIKDAIASIFFLENWWLFLSGTNYLARGEIASPFQHMWALSVQMQVYVALPIIFIALSFIFRGSKYFYRDIRLALACFLFLGFAYAILVTEMNQASAYFNTWARFWEFLSGALFASVVHKLNLSRVWSWFIGYGCLLILTFYAALISVGSHFPGVAAVVPVVATVGIILAANNGANLRLLNNRLTQRLGDISFTFYLWHWPILIGYLQTTGVEAVSFFAGVLIITASLILACITYFFFEVPFRKSSIINRSFAHTTAASVLVMLPAIGTVGFWGVNYISAKERANHDVEILLSGGNPVGVVPAPVIAKWDKSESLDKSCSQRWDKAELIECTFGNMEGEKVVMLVGGSHSAHWLPALQTIASTDRSLKILNITKAGCPLTLSSLDLNLGAEKACLSWSKDVIKRINEIKPRAVFTLLTSTRTSSEQAGDFIPQGFLEAWRLIPDIPIISIRDTPRADFDVALCVDRFGPDSENCSIDRKKNLNPYLSDILSNGEIDSLNLPSNVFPIDVSDLLCGESICSAVTGNVLKFRDQDHFTATYARVLAPEIHSRVKEYGIFID
ncbi:acyltransferase family protein [uncultured Microbulbifer sp.]|uniref:acyltransferase family protein n=1 Tax=uncultured Microbulbifer sp. TaxID=348147 RepID=UPI002634FFF9|nr:acyltransferase family protein [uncultured Microbulbifer sp.]